MDYGDNAAADVVTTAADHLWRFVQASASFHMGLTSESGMRVFVCLFILNAAAKGYQPVDPICSTCTPFGRLCFYPPCKKQIKKFPLRKKQTNQTKKKKPKKIFKHIFLCISLHPECIFKFRNMLLKIGKCSFGEQMNCLMTDLTRHYQSVLNWLHKLCHWLNNKCT